MSEAVMAHQGAEEMLDCFKGEKLHEQYPLPADEEYEELIELCLRGLQLANFMTMVKEVYKIHHPGFKEDLKVAHICGRVFSLKEWRENNLRSKELQKDMYQLSLKPSLKEWRENNLQSEELQKDMDQLSLKPGRSSTASSSSASTFSLFSSRTVHEELTSQDKAEVALKSELDDSLFPKRDNSSVCLWNNKLWNNIMKKDINAEAKFKKLIECVLKRRELKSVFVKGKKGVCPPMVPDFFLVSKGNEEEVVPINAGAILYTQSTSKHRSYTEAKAVGEAITIGQIFLKHVPVSRGFIYGGLTNLRTIRWFKV